jgi:hypothetical protein
VLLRQPAEAVSVTLDFIDVQIALIVQRPQELAHALEHGGEIGRLFVLGVGALADMDIEPAAGELLLRERIAAGEPVSRVSRFHDDGGDLGILVQDLCGEFGNRGGNVGFQRGRLARARIGDGDEGHDRSP